MNRKIALFACLLALCLTLSACIFTPATSNPVSEAESSSEVSTEVSAEESTPEKPVTPAGEEKAHGRYDLSYIEKITNLSAVKAYDERTVLVTYMDYDAQECGFAAYDIYTGEKVASAVLDSIYELSDIIVYDDGAFSVSSIYGFYAFFGSLDATPEVLSLAAPELEDSESYEQFYFVRDMGYFRCDGGGAFLGTDSRDTEKMIIDAEAVDSARFAFERNGLYYFTGYAVPDYSALLLTYDPSSNEVSVVGSTGRYDYTKYGDLLFERDYFEDSISFTRDATPYSATTVMLEDKDEELKETDGDYLLTYLIKYNENMDSAYELLTLYTTGGDIVFKDEVADRSMSIASCSFSAKGNYIVAFSTIYGDEGLDDAVVTLTVFFPDERVDRTGFVYGSVSRSLAVAYSLNEQYGVTIKLGSAAIVSFPDFSAETETDERTIMEALVSLEKTFGRFPDGFFKELMEPIEGNDYCQTELCICLTGKLTPLNEYSTSMPIAYAYTDGTCYYVVLDITYSTGDMLMQNLSHELMHTMESRIFNLDGDGFSDWYDYAPDSAYNYSYVDSHGDDFSGTKYTVYDDAHTVYFIDSYSRTFPTEDRARLFENLFMSENGLDGVFTENPKILERTRYLCEVIRESFESVRDADEVWWERFLYDD